MLYRIHEAERAWLRPIAQVSQANACVLRTLPGPFSSAAAAGWELLHRITKEYDPPRFGIESVFTRGAEVSIHEEAVDVTPFCKLTRFARRSDDPAVLHAMTRDPKVLLCAPLSGHFATLLRDTVRSMAPDHDVYVTEWADAREVPLSEGVFGLDDYVLHLERFLRFLGVEETHVVAVCQPAVPALAAVARMASAGGPVPPSLVLMAGPIDGRVSPTQVNRLAHERPISWFEKNLVHRVPRSYPGAGRRVYPGFLQLTAFVSMQPTRHADAYRDYWMHRAIGDFEAAERHVRFYDDYNAVLDMDAAYYLDTVRHVFQEHTLARGIWDVVGERVRPADIRNTAVLTVEGSNDDITGPGQTHAAHALLTGLPAARKERFTAGDVGHYGVFSGRRWREKVYPHVRDFIRQSAPRAHRESYEENGS